MSGGYVPIGAVSEACEGREGREGSARVWRFAAADGMRAEVALLAEDSARVRLVPAGGDPARSWAVDVRAERDGSALVLTTTAMRVHVMLDPLRVGFRWPDGVAFAEDDPQLGMGIVPPIGPGDLPSADFPVGSVHCTKLFIAEAGMSARQRRAVHGGLASIGAERDTGDLPQQRCPPNQSPQSRARNARLRRNSGLRGSGQHLRNGPQIAVEWFSSFLIEGGSIKRWT